MIDARTTLELRDAVRVLESSIGWQMLVREVEAHAAGCELRMRARATSHEDRAIAAAEIREIAFLLTWPGRKYSQLDEQLEKGL